MKTYNVILTVLGVLIFNSCNESKKDSNSEVNDQVAMSVDFERGSTFATEIGYLDSNNKFHFKSASIKDQVEVDYENVAKDQGFTVDFEDFVFIDAANNNGYYMLEANGVDKSGTTVNTAGGVTVNSSRAVFTDEEQTKITCSGCRRGCSPRRDSSGDGYCTECRIQNSNCTKTETLGGQ